MVSDWASSERQSSSTPPQWSGESLPLGKPFEKIAHPRNNINECYNQVNQDQIEGGIIERVSGPVTGHREFYMPHKGVVRKLAETTKLCVAYNTSACGHSGAPSLQVRICEEDCDALRFHWLKDQNSHTVFTYYVVSSLHGVSTQDQWLSLSMWLDKRTC